MIRAATGSRLRRGVIFAIEARDGIDPAKTSAALESISVTDDKGRYRLEMRGSLLHRFRLGGVSDFFARYADIASAREVRVTAGSVVENVDFSSFVPRTDELSSIRNLRCRPDQQESWEECFVMRMAHLHRES